MLSAYRHKKDWVCVDSFATKVFERSLGNVTKQLFDYIVMKIRLAMWYIVI